MAVVVIAKSYLFLFSFLLYGELHFMLKISVFSSFHINFRRLFYGLLAIKKVGLAQCKNRKRLALTEQNY